MLAQSEVYLPQSAQHMVSRKQLEGFGLSPYVAKQVVVGAQPNGGSRALARMGLRRSAPRDGSPTAMTFAFLVDTAAKQEPDPSTVAQASQQGGASRSASSKPPPPGRS